MANTGTDNIEAIVDANAAWWLPELTPEYRAPEAWPEGHAGYDEGTAWFTSWYNNDMWNDVFDESEGLNAEAADSEGIKGYENMEYFPFPMRNVTNLADSTQFPSY